MAKVKISRGQQNAYDGLATKDNDTIYVCTDTGNIYLGSTVLFESDAFKNASVNGKIVTFTTHGTNATAGSKTLDLASFATTSEVATAIANAISCVYKPAGSIDARSVTAGNVLTEANLGNVYNLSGDLTLSQTSAALFVGDYTEGETIVAGTNLVVVRMDNSIATDYRFDVLAGFVDLSNYQTKVANATLGHIATFDGNGQVVDSGNETADFKTRQTAKTDPTANGTTITVIATLTQNENGEVTATKKTIQDGTTSQKGIVQLEDSHTSTSTTKAATPKNVKEAYDLAAGKVSDVKTGTTSQNAASVVDGTTKVATLLTGTAYNASTNKIATMADVADGALDWGSF